jgi:hypothetical protein
MNGILLPAYVENITTRKDKTVKITLGSQELSQGKAGELFSLLNNLAIVYIAPKEISQKEIDQVDKLDPELAGKSQSQRIRSVLYLLFMQDSEGHKDFDGYYKSKTDKYIDHLKSKINDE